MRAAIVGSPVAHSLSPVIHTAGYAAAGLTGWTYTACDCDEAGFAEFVGGLGPEWAGLSVTMPLKRSVLELADEVSPLAAALGAANTLLLAGGRRRVDNTDAPGMADALRAAGVGSARRVAITGAGGTARAALGAARDLGAERVTVYARRPEIAGAALRPVAERLGMPLDLVPWSDLAAAAGCDVLVSTVPAGIADDLATSVPWHAGMVVFDVVYHPWPTPLARAAAAAGATVVDGLELLLTQAVRQFELLTGVSAPVPAMRTAMLDAAGRRAGAPA